MSAHDLSIHACVVFSVLSPLFNFSSPPLYLKILLIKSRRRRDVGLKKMGTSFDLNIAMFGRRDDLTMLERRDVGTS